MSQITIATLIIVVGALVGVLLWQVLEIGKERARAEGGDSSAIARRVGALEDRIASIENRAGESTP